MDDKQDQELRDAIRNAAFPPTRLAVVQAWAKQAGVTPEEFINIEIDGRLESGEGESFRVFRANHGRYPSNYEEMRQATEEWNLEKGNSMIAACGSHIPRVWRFK